MSGDRRWVLIPLLGSVASWVWLIVTIRVVWTFLVPDSGESIQVVDALLSLLILGSGAGWSLWRWLQEPAPLPGVRAFTSLFPRIPNETAVMLRDSPPKLTDFESGYIVRPPDTSLKVMKRLQISEEGLPDSGLSKHQAQDRFKVAALAGPPGCGKTTTALRLGYDLSLCGWKVFLCDAAELLTNNSMVDIGNWLLSFRGRVLLIVDNAQSVRERAHTLSTHLADRAHSADLIASPRFRVLFLESFAHTMHQRRPPELQATVRGRRVARLPLTTDHSIGLGLTPVLQTGTPAVVGRIPGVMIVEGHEIAETIFNRFTEVESGLVVPAFETLFRETGTVVELCEVLRLIRSLPSDASGDRTQLPWENLATSAVERRLRTASDREKARKVIGLVSVFTQAGAMVAREFIDEVIASDVSCTVTELEEAQHLVRRHVGPASREFILGTHPAVASLIRRGCSAVLSDLTGTEDALDVDISLYDRYLRFLKGLPPKTSELIASSFVLTLASHSAAYGIRKLVDFVVTECDSEPTKDTNIILSLYNAGVYYFSADCLEEAQDALRTVGKLDPDFYQARTNLAMVLFFNGQSEAARSELDAILEEHPQEASVLGNIGVVLVELGEYDLALQRLQEATILSSKDARYWHNLGRAEMRMGRTPDAIEHHKKAIELDPDESEYYVSLSYALVTSGDAREAEHILRNAINKGIRTPMVLGNLGSALRKLGRTDEARKQFEQCLEAYPSYSLAYVGLGDAEIAAGQFDQAEDHLRRALELNPASGETRALLGLALQNQRRLAESRSAYEEALNQGYAAPEVKANLAILCYELDDPAAFESWLEQAVSSSDNPALILAEIPQFLHSKRNQTLSDAYASRLRSLLDQYLRNGLFLKAEPVLERLAELAPRNLALWVDLGVARAQLGNLSEAKSAFERAIELKPDEPGLWHNLGNVLKALGREVEAAEAYAKARQLAEQSGQHASKSSPEDAKRREG